MIAEPDWIGGMHAVMHMLVSLLPLYVICDPWDMAGLTTESHVDTRKSQIVVYDAAAGGVGMSKAAFRHLAAQLRRCLMVLEQCQCSNGCPACMHSPRCNCYNQGLDKTATLLILRGLQGNASAGDAPAMPVSS